VWGFWHGHDKIGDGRVITPGFCRREGQQASCDVVRRGGTIHPLPLLVFRPEYAMADRSCLWHSSSELKVAQSWYVCAGSRGHQEPRTCHCRFRAPEIVLSGNWNKHALPRASSTRKMWSCKAGISSLRPQCYKAVLRCVAIFLPSEASTY